MYQNSLPIPDHAVAEGTRQRAEDALRHIGTNALPTLITMLRAKDSQFKLKLVALANKQQLVHVPPFRTRERHVSASYALLVLGPTAKAAEPELLDLMFYGEQDVRRFATMIVKQIDPEYIAKLDDIANASTVLWEYWGDPREWESPKYDKRPNPQAGADMRQLVASDTNRTSATAASRRSP